MKKYQIVEAELEDIINHAGKKAPDDVAKFVSEEGYTNLYINRRTKHHKRLYEKIFNHLGFMYDWLKILVKVKKNSLILIQYRTIGKRLFRKESLNILLLLKKCKFIFLVHDIGEIRKTRDSTDYPFMLKHAAVIIVHNKKMKEFLIQKKYARKQIIVLNIFDYDLGENEPVDKRIERTIVIAGNLDRDKAGYVYKLLEKKVPPFINLYGPNFSCDVKSSEFFKHWGEYRPDVLPTKLVGGLGIIWDGDNLETCTGKFGNYLKYNSPHKLSLYLVSGLPVIIWEEAESAEFVLQNNVGITISNLNNLEEILNKITEEELTEMSKNARRLSNKLKKGYYTKEAVRKAEKQIRSV